MRHTASVDEQRVERILSRIRAEVGLRDFLIFGLGRIWIVLLVLCAFAYKALNRPVSRRSEVARTERRLPARMIDSQDDRRIEDA